jgi:hypothetical protein
VGLGGTVEPTACPVHSDRSHARCARDAPRPVPPRASRLAPRASRLPPPASRLAPPASRLAPRGPPSVSRRQSTRLAPSIRLAPRTVNAPRASRRQRALGPRSSAPNHHSPRSPLQAPRGRGRGAAFRRRLLVAGASRTQRTRRSTLPPLGGFRSRYLTRAAPVPRRSHVAGLTGRGRARSVAVGPPPHNTRAPRPYLHAAAGLASDVARRAAPRPAAPRVAATHRSCRRSPTTAWHQHNTQTPPVRSNTTPRQPAPGHLLPRTHPHGLARGTLPWLCVRSSRGRGVGGVWLMYD